MDTGRFAADDDFAYKIFCLKPISHRTAYTVGFPCKQHNWTNRGLNQVTLEHLSVSVKAVYVYNCNWSPLHECAHTFLNNRHTTNTVKSMNHTWSSTIRLGLVWVYTVSMSVSLSMISDSIIWHLLHRPMYFITRIYISVSLFKVPNLMKPSHQSE